MNNSSLNLQKQVTLLSETSLSTPKKLCEDIPVEMRASFQVSIAISLILCYVMLSLVVYAFKKKYLFVCDGM